MTGNLLGESFDEYVREQIQIRQQLYGSGFNSLRTTPQINYLNNRNAWIKMASSVSIEGNPLVSATPTRASIITNQSIINIGEERLKKIGIPNPSNFLGTNLAQKAVLFNGLSSVTPSTFQTNTEGEIISRTYGSYQFRSGVTKSNSIWNQEFAYGLGGTNFGLQPMPGIVDFTVEAVNRGSIRKGTVTIKAFNRFQFELIELLYIRLGYTMLVEWGWDKYPITNDNGEVIIESTGNTIIEDIWFNKNDYTQITMLQAIERYREIYNGNYDAFFGKVSNFDWSFNPDGSYDITLNLITIGDVIESLKIKNKVLPLNLPEKNKDESILISNINNNAINQHLYLTIKTPERYFEINNEDNNEGNTKYYKRLIEIIKAESKYKYYITLGKLLDLIKDKVIPNIDTKYNKSNKQIDIDTGNLNICNSYKNHISLDPRVCLIKPNFFRPDKFTETNKLFKDWWDFTKEKEICEGTPKKKYTYGDIMYIYLNYEFIAECLQNTINDEEVNIYEFLNKVCQGINKALGGVTNLEPVIKDDYIITIIEQNPLPIDLIEALGGNVDNTPVPLEIYGYNTSTNTSNFVKNISFKTKITPQLSSQISIGATSEGIGTQNYEATAFSKWNDGLEDRFTYKYSQANSSDDIDLSGDGWNPSDDKLEILRKNAAENKRKFGTPIDYTFPNGDKLGNYSYKILNNKTSFIAKFREESKRIQSQQKTKDDIAKTKYENTWEGYLDNAFRDQKYFNLEPDFINKGKDIFSTTYKTLINNSYRDKGEVINTIGFIPVTFDITLDGISGIKIYQKLEIQQDFLPYQYPQAFDFLITKVNHKISDNSWDTQLNTISTSNLKNLPSEPLTVIGNLESDVVFGPLQEPPPTNISSTPDPSITLTEETDNTDPLKPLKDLIAFGESNGVYNIANIGSLKYTKSTTNVTSETIQKLFEYSRLNQGNPKRVFAMGKYQIIPDTLREVLSANKVTESNIFNKETQEKIGDWLILDYRSNLSEYIKGKNNGTKEDLADAIQSIGQIWASMPCFRLKNGTIVADLDNLKGNTAYYGGVGTNPSKSKVTINQMVNALIQSRVKYSNKQPSFKPV
jgi:hypothetical protein